jgi:hypothetical protein
VSLFMSANPAAISYPRPPVKPRSIVMSPWAPAYFLDNCPDPPALLCGHAWLPKVHAIETSGRLPCLGWRHPAAGRHPRELAQAIRSPYRCVGEGRSHLRRVTRNEQANRFQVFVSLRGPSYLSHLDMRRGAGVLSSIYLCEIERKRESTPDVVQNYIRKFAEPSLQPDRG